MLVNRKILFVGIDREPYKEIMSGPYQPKPEDGEPLTAPAPPNYTYASGYQHQQQPQPQPHLLNTLPEVFRRNRDDDDREEQCDPDLAEEVRIPVEHLNLEFRECFKEHKSAQTHPHLKKFTEVMYKYTLIIVYHFFVVLFGVVSAFLFAIINAVMAFIHVWIYGPLLKLSILWVYATAPLVVAPIRAMYRPLVDASARVFRQIRVDGNLHGSYAERLAGSSQPRERANV